MGFLSRAAAAHRPQPRYAPAASGASTAGVSLIPRRTASGVQRNNNIFYV